MSSRAACCCYDSKGPFDEKKSDPAVRLAEGEVGMLPRQRLDRVVQQKHPAPRTPWKKNLADDQTLQHSSAGDVRGRGGQY